MIKFKNKIDMVPGKPHLVIPLSQYDTDVILEFELFASDGSFTVEADTTAQIRGTKPDGNGISLDATLTSTQDTDTGLYTYKVTVAVTQQMTAVSGRSFYELSLFKDSKELNTANFILAIERAALDKDTIKSASEIREIQETIDRTDEFLGAARSITADRQVVEQALSDAQAAKTAAETAQANAESAQSAAARSAQAAADDLASLDTALQSALDDLDDAKDTALGDVSDKAAEVNEEIDTKAQQILTMTTNAEEIASTALTHATDAENEVAEFINTQGNLKERLDAMELKVLEAVNNGYVENGVAYFAHDNEVLFTITGIGGGGGGGGDQSTTTMAIANTSGWVSKTIESTGTCPISFTWSSTQDDLPTGNGTVQVLVDRVVRASFDKPQGSNTIDVASYVSNGSHVVTIKVIDISGNSRSLNYNVTKVVLSLASYFDSTQIYTGPFVFSCTPVGNVEKTLYYYIDGQLAESKVTSLSNKEVSITIPAQSHGAHSLRVYFTAEINGEVVTSNELYYEFIYAEPLNNSVIITSNFRGGEYQQYSNIVVPFMVYNPQSATSEVVISIDEVEVSTRTVDRTEQTYTYKANTDGEHTIKFVSGRTALEKTVTVTESQIDIQPVTENLALYLTSEGRTNTSEDRADWHYEDIQAALTGFNWTSDGWQTDTDGATCLRVAGDARVTIPYKLFGTDFRTSGKTIELEFATRNVLDYDATILSCLSGGRGLNVTAQKATLTSEQSAISTQYKEDEHVRLAFVCRKRADARLLFIYINGVASGVVAYPDDDDFSQVTPVDISIGSNDCTIDLYNIRVYDTSLSGQEIVENWIADTQDGSLMLDRYTRNNVYDAYGKITINNLPTDLPYLIISAPVLPSSKGDKKPCSGTYVDPVHPAKGFTFADAEIDIQGTSSQYYPRKNWKIKFGGGFDMNGGSHAEKYAMNERAIPVKTFCFKADVASSEGANNVELAILYEDIVEVLDGTSKPSGGTYSVKTPAQKANAKVRQTIDGFPIVIFYDDGEETTFTGKYNFNSDKSTEDVFGFADPDESWETLNNTGLWALWKTANYSDSGWLTDFEARYPDTKPAYEDPTQLQSFAEWIIQTDRTTATGNALAESVTYDGVTYTNDTADYRLAKFKAEVSNYVEIDNALLYWLFTEMFLMVDSRAKNAFPSFIGEAVVTG